MAKNLGGNKIETCGECPRFNNCTHHLYVRGKISDACVLPEWREPGAEVRVLITLEEWQTTMDSMSNSVHDSHLQSQEHLKTISRLQKENLEQAARIRELEAESNDRRAIKDEPEKWPEVEVVPASNDYEHGYHIMLKNKTPIRVSDMKSLTRAQAEAVVRAYRFITEIANGMVGLSTHVYPEDARRILKGE